MTRPWVCTDIHVFYTYNNISICVSNDNRFKHRNNDKTNNDSNHDTNKTRMIDNENDIMISFIINIQISK